MEKEQQRIPVNPEFSFLEDGGETSLRVRARDWGQSPLGPIDHWPQTLRAAVGFLLHSPVPGILFWGEELCAIHNDAFRRLLGDRHPDPLGRTFPEIWREKADHFIPLAEKALRGEPDCIQRAAFMVRRHGVARQMWFDVYFSPLRDENGRLAGLQNTLVETTRQVLSERRLAVLAALAEVGRAAGFKEKNVLKALGAVLARHVDDLPFALLYLLDESRHFLNLAMTSGLPDGTGLSPEQVDLRQPDGIWPLKQVLVSGQMEESQHFSFHLQSPNLPLDQPRQALILPVPVQDHARTGGLLVTGISPSSHLDDDYRRFLEIVASLIAAALNKSRALRAMHEDHEVFQIRQQISKSEQRWSEIFARVAVGLCEISPQGMFRHVNSELCRILGRTREQLLTMGVSDVTHPDDAAHSIEALTRLIQTGEPASLDKRYVKPDGTVVFANSALTRLDDEYGDPQAVLAVTVDLSERKRAEMEIREINENLERHVNIRTAELRQRNQEIREMAHKTISAMETERSSLAKDLHDSVGGTLSAIRYQLEARVEDMGPPPDAVGMTLEKIIDYLAAAVNESRRITKQLRPSVLDDFGLPAAIEQCIRDFEQFHPEITIERHIRVADHFISNDIKTVIYRVLQEALNNIGKHSEAAAVRVELASQKRTLSLIVQDDGQGFDVTEKLSSPDALTSFGLRSMKERVEICKGTFRIESRPGTGTRIRAVLPETLI